MVVVFSIIIEHSKDCDKMKNKAKTKKAVNFVEVYSRQLVFNNAKEVKAYWRKLSNDLGIPKMRIDFRMFGDCILQ